MVDPQLSGPYLSEPLLKITVLLQYFQCTLMKRCILIIITLTA